MKVEIFTCAKIDQLGSAINDFIKDKKVIDIKYQTVAVPTEYDTYYPYRVSNINIIDRVLIMYEERL